MAAKRSAAPSPPPPASSEDIVSDSVSDESEEEEEEVVRLQKGEESDGSDEEESEEEVVQPQKGEESDGSDEEESEEEVVQPQKGEESDGSDEEESEEELVQPQNGEESDGSDEEESEEELVQPQKGEESDGSDEEESEEEDRVPTSALPSSATKSSTRPPQNHEETDASDEEEEEEGESFESDKAPPLSPAPKQGAEGKGREAKRPAFQRIWSTEDEVRIVEALAAHRREHGKLPQIDAVVATLAGSLDNRGFGRKELQAKINTLRRRYEATAKKAELPSNGHDRRLFDLSKIVWGSDDAVGPAAVAEANGAARREFDEMCELYPHLAEEVKALEAAHPGLFKRDFGKLDDDKARSLDVKIKKHRIAQITVELHRGDLTKEVTKVLAELVE